MKKVLIIVLVLIVGGGYGVWYYINRPVGDLSSKKADIKISAVDLLKAYGTNEVEADSMYNSKVLLVNGKVLKINKTLDSTFNILIDTGDPMSTILCQMDKSIAVDTNAVRPGTMVHIKGVCAGFLGDVIIDRALIVKGD